MYAQGKLHDGYSEANVGFWERIISGVLGAKLVKKGLRQRSVLMGTAVTATGGYLAYRGLSGRCEMYRRMGMDAPRREIGVVESISVLKSPEEIYAFWRDVRNIPRVVRHALEVESVDERRSRWLFFGPADVAVEWEAVITREQPPEFLEWRSVDGSQVQHRGRIDLIPMPGNRGTKLRVSMAYWPPGGTLSALLAKLFGREPRQEIRDVLRRFKQMMETGEIADNRGPSARQMGMRKDTSETESSTGQKQQPGEPIGAGAS